MKVAIPIPEKTKDKSKLKSGRKPRKSKPLQTRPQLDDTGKLSVAQCKAVLTKDGAEYSDEQVALVRQVLYALAEVDYKYHSNLRQRDGKFTLSSISTSNITTHNEQQDRYSLHPRIYGRTG